MKTVLNKIVFVASILYCGIAYSQNEIVTLTSSDFIKGLNNIDYFREKLTENGFKIVGKERIDLTKTGSVEYWKLTSMAYVDILYSSAQESVIKVGIDEAFTGLPERLIQSFPRNKSEGRDVHLPNITAKPINKEIFYSLAYPRDTDKVVVVIWFDKPYYFFEYKREK